MFVSKDAWTNLGIKIVSKLKQLVFCVNFFFFFFDFRDQNQQSRGELLCCKFRINVLGNYFHFHKTKQKTK